MPSSHRASLERAAWAAALALFALAIVRASGDYTPGGMKAAWLVTAAAAAWVVSIAAATERAVGVWLGIALVAWLPAVDLWLCAMEVRAPVIAALAAPIAALLRCTGIGALAVDGVVQIETHEGLIGFAPSFDQLAIRPIVLVGAAGLLAVLLLGGRGAWRRAAAIVTATSALLVVRHALLVALVADRDGILTETHPPLVAFFCSDLAVAPFVLLLSAGCAWLLPATPAPSPATNRAPCSALLSLASAGALLLGFALVVVPSGPAKSGRVVVDDTHGGHWEPAARRLDTSNWGDYATYSLASAVEQLGREFAVSVNVGRVLDDALLAECDVLVLKTPEEAYAPAEVAAMQRFVERGGGLLLVSDHTDLMGMSTHLNGIAADFGVAFVNDGVSCSDGSFSLFAAGPFAHPAARRQHDLLFMTSCSLAVSFAARPVVVAKDSVRERGDYGNSSNFGAGPDLATPYGPAVLAATIDAGRGRVAWFTDSTTLSSFDVFKHGRYELLEDLIHFLDHEAPRFPWVRPIAAAIGALLLLFGLVQSASGRPRLMVAVVAAAALWAGLHAAGAANRASLPSAAPQAPAPVVSFLAKGGFCAFPPVLGGIGDLPDEACFDTLFVEPQRLGLAPRTAMNYDETLGGASALVVLNPVEAPPAGFTTELSEWVAAGGALLVAERHDSLERSAAGAFLQPFGVSLELVDAATAHLHVNGAERVELPAPALLAFRKEVGRGVVVFLLGSEELVRKGLGHCFSIPDSEEAPRHQAVFTLFRELLHLDAGDRRTYRILEAAP